MKNVLLLTAWRCGVALILASATLSAAGPAGAASTLPEVVHVSFDGDTPGQPPQTGGPNQPTYLEIRPGTSILVHATAIGITTQPAVITAQTAGQYASIATLFNPVSGGVVRIEATAAFDRLVDGYFFDTTAGSGPFPFAVVTRLITRDLGVIQDDGTRTTVGTYAPHQPLRFRIDIDMATNTWSATVDNEMNGFDDDPVIANLPFENPVEVLPTVGGAWASLSLFPTPSEGPTAVAFDDIQVFVPPPVSTATSTSWGRVKSIYR